ncbi:MAG: cytochrome b/b6 domain-containing protein [Sphingobium sp.]
MASRARIKIWDAPTRLFHWSVVGLLGFSWWSAETHRMDWHQLSGLTLAGLVIFRLIWGVIGSSTARFAGFVKGPRAIWTYLRSGGHDAIGHNPLGALSVVALLAVLAAQIGSGLLAVDIDGIESGPLSYLVDFDQGRLASSVHDIMFTILQALVVLHILAVLFYLVIKKRNLIAPMVSGSQTANGPDTEPLVAAPLWRLAVAAIIAGMSAYALSRGFQF